MPGAAPSVPVVGAMEQAEGALVAIVPQSIEFALCYLEKYGFDDDDLGIQGLTCLWFSSNFLHPLTRGPGSATVSDSLLNPFKVQDIADMGLKSLFVVIYKYKGPYEIKIPSEFFKRWEHNMTNPLLMTTYDGTIWEVDIAATNSGLWLNGGWDDIATIYGIKRYSVVLFKFVGDGKFELEIYSKSAVENYRMSCPRISLPYKFFKALKIKRSLKSLRLPQSFGRLFGTTLSNPITLVAMDQTEWLVDWTMVGDMICLRGGWISFVTKFSIRLGDIIFFKYNGFSQMELMLAQKKRGLIRTARKCTKIPTVPMHVNEQTMWTTKISSSHVIGCEPMVIPAGAIQLYLSFRPSNIKFMMPNGEIQTWSLLWTEDQPNQCHIGIGWYNLIATYNLTTAHEVRFYVANTEEFIRLEVNEVTD